MKAFLVCDGNADGALTWKEVEDCEVRPLFLNWESSMLMIFSFQDNFCDIVSFDCPTQEDFNNYDGNDDGVVTWEEYTSQLTV